MTKTKTLYKRTATGATQLWWMEIEGAKYRACSGQLDGVITKAEWTTAKPKNAGRANATTAEQQAVLEATATYEKKQRREGYTLSVDMAQASTRFSPMRAESYKDRRDLVETALRNEGGVIAQPKFDGVRCIATRDGLFSRKATPIPAPRHIMRQLVGFFHKWPEAVLDGELYNHSLSDDFDRLISICRKQVLSEEEYEEAEQLQYWIFDHPSPHVAALPYHERMADLLGTFPSIFDAPDIKLTLTVDIHSIEELDANYEAFLGEGFEGQMIRINSAPYQQKRTKWLLKRKEFIDAEYQITDIVEGTGNRSGMAGYAVLILNKTTTFKSAFKFPREKLREILRNADKYIAGDATVRYQNLTPRGVPRFPRITVLHPGGRKL